MRLRRKPRLCGDLLRGYHMAGAGTDWPCELPAGHDGMHERTSPPVTGRWTTTIRPNSWSQHVENLCMGDGCTLPGG